MRRREDLLGPGQRRRQRRGTCRDKAGNPGSGSLPLKYDATAPQVATSPARAANANGWYNAPLAVSFAGDRPDVRRRLVRSSQDLLGPGQRGGSRRRHVQGQRRKLRARLVPAEVRRHRAASERDAGPPAERGRLVQRLALRQLRRHRRHLRDRLVRRREDLLRPRQRRRQRQRHLPRQGRKPGLRLASRSGTTRPPHR